MVEPLGLGSGVHDLKLGSSFDQGSAVGFHSIRYDFKPASVDTKKMASLNIEEGKSVTVNVPHMAGSGTTHTVFKGNKRPIQKECVLIIDHQTGEITLEKLSNTLQLKKTRIEGSSKASQQAARPLTPSEQMKQMKMSPSKKSKKSQQQQQQQSSQPSPQMTSHKKEPVAPPPPQPAEASPVVDMSESESGEASSSDSSDDEQPPAKSSPVKEHNFSMPATLSMPSALSMPASFGATSEGQSQAPSQKQHTQGRNRYASMLSEDLRLSESGSDSD